MSDALPDNAQGPITPDPDTRPPVSPPLQGIAPAWVDPGEETAPSEQPAGDAEVQESMHGFTLERGGRNGIAGTAERIGSAVGSAQRQMRRGLELVRRPASQIGAASSAVAAETTERANQIAQEGADRASQVFDDIKDEILDSREQAARKLDEWSERTGERLQQFRYRALHALSRSQERVQQFAEAYPLQTIATVAGVCFAFGVALRLRRSHRG
jgi:ElaB/YqjD/DUF883 family membrane-anchored ribosome-binding protein